MSYYFYENWPTGHKATIHLGCCSWCKEGRGCHPVRSSAGNGRWSVSFRTLQQAEAAAHNTKAKVSKCAHCLGPVAL